MYLTDKTVAILHIMAWAAVAGHMTFMIPLIIVVGLVIVIKREFRR